MASATLATPTTSPLLPSTPAGITPDNHGPRVLIVGGIMLASTLLVIVIAAYNRHNAHTMHHMDSALILAGAVLDIGCFALVALAVKNGFGYRREGLSESAEARIRELFLGSILIFFTAHGVIKISYNLLARHTARSWGFKVAMDSFSVAIGLWAVSSISVIAVALHTGRSPKRVFFWISGAISIAIVLAQLSAFLWVIWRTRAKRGVKLRWSFSMGVFVPLCIAAIIVRLAYTPADYFAGDWTFDDVVQGMLFQIELNLMTITVLAPNLPVFFQKTSTGGVFFLPGEATQGSRRGMSLSNGQPVQLGKLRWSRTRWPEVLDGKGNNEATSSSTTRSQASGGGKPQGRRTSFDSDLGLVQRLDDIERGVEMKPESSQEKDHEAQETAA